MAGEDIRVQADAMVGETIAQRYKLEGVLGYGGTGVVYRATDLTEGGVYALKTIRSDLAHERAISRFFRGARLASGLEHVGLVPTLAFGQAKEPHPTPFQVMPLVEGPSWEQLNWRLLRPSEAVWLGCQVLDALAYVHARGVLHRDIKPANIILERQPDDTLLPRITDFGIAAAFLSDMTDMKVTGGNLLIGTPTYMAPEQAQSGSLHGPQLDLYALGVVLYQTLSGRLPFRGTPMEMLAAKATIDAPPLEVDGLQPDIVKAVATLISRDPGDRFALAAQARRAIEHHAEPLVVSDARMMELFRKRSSTKVVRRAVVDWKPPGEGTIERDWPTLIVAQAAPKMVDELPGRQGVFRAIATAANDVERGHVRLVSVLGEAGMGKTAVLERVASDLVEQGRFLVLRAPYFEGGSQGGGVRRGIERMLGVHGLQRSEVLSAVEEILGRYDDVWPEEPEQLVDCLRPPPDLPAEALAARLGEQMALVARLLRRLSQTRPMLLLIDDADKGSGDLSRFLDFMLMEARFDRWPMLILCGVGVSAEESHFWRGVQRSESLRGAAHKRVRLHPLPDDVLSQDLIRRHGLSQAEARRIVARAGGNPLHAGYLAEMLASEMSQVEMASDETSSSVSIAMPRALLGLMELRLQKHLDSTEDSEAAQSLLEAIAVLGEAAEEDLVRALLSPAQQVNYERSLDALLSLGVLGIVDHAEPLVLGFTPALLREAVLSNATEKRLLELHKLAVGARMELAPDRRRGHLGSVGDHYAAAGMLQDAQRFWLKGLQHEVSTGNVMRGVNWGRRAIDEMNVEDPSWAYTTLLVATMCFDAGEAETAEVLMRSVLASGSIDRKLQAGDLLGDLLENQGQVAPWGALIEEMSALEDGASDEGRCALYSARSLWFGHVGKNMEALADAQRALELAMPGPPAQRAAQRLAFANLPVLQLDAALSAAKRSLSEAANVPLLRVRSLRTLGLVQLWKHQPSAIETLESAADLCRQAGMLTRHPIALHDLGDAYRVFGRYADAREKYTQTIRLCEGLPLTSTLVLCRFKLAICDVGEGRPRAVMGGMEELIAQGVEVGLGLSPPFGALIIAWAHVRCRDLSAALNAMRDVGPLERIQIDPQVPEIMVDMVEGLVEGVLSNPSGVTHLKQVVQVVTEARDVFGGSGDVGRLQRAETLLRRLPSIPV